MQSLKIFRLWKSSTIMKMWVFLSLWEDVNSKSSKNSILNVPFPRWARPPFECRCLFTSQKLYLLKCNFLLYLCLLSKQMLFLCYFYFSILFLAFSHSCKWFYNVLFTFSAFYYQKSKFLIDLLVLVKKIVLFSFM